MIEREVLDDMVLLRLAHGSASALDPEFLEAIRQALLREKDSATAAVVLTGSGSIFSAGVDLKRLLAGGADYVDLLLPALSRCLETLYTLPLPVVAAVNGHAIAGGAVIACACDWRIMTQGRGRMGVPELLVGVPFPAVALEIMRAAVGTHRLAELVYMGRTLTPQAALAMHLVDECVEDSALLDRALASARHLAAIPAEVFRVTKHSLRSKTVARWKQQREASDAAVRTAWTSDAVRTAVRIYVERNLASKGRAS